MVAHTRGANQRDTGQSLKFKDKLVGKGLSTDALLGKLQVLHQELATLDQERVDAKADRALNAVCRELVDRALLLHKDRGVKAYVACCLADILRIFAPDAPYTPARLADIFDFFLRQLAAGLTAADAPYYDQYHHLLESLSSVKSAVLVCDLPGADALIAQVFKEFFALARRNLPKRIEIFMADILVTLIDQAQTMPSAVLERSLLPQFRGKAAVRTHLPAALLTRCS
jgi:sister-chromatid-cohesion protein PDS5